MNAILTLVHIFGFITIGFSGLMGTCLITSLAANDGASSAFIEAIKITLLSGLLMFLPTLKQPKKVSRQSGFLLVATTWTFIPVFCTLPLIFYLPTVSFIEAYFETVSGLTTTGATILTGLDTLPMSINLWRHELNWIAGMGIIIFAVAILPILGIGGMQLAVAESPGTVKDSDLPPRIAQTAKALWMVYFGITLACIVALYWAGMSWFDAICHAFAAMSLGGFSTHDANVGYFNSIPIEVVLSIFQLIAAINFATHFVVLKKRSLKLYLKDMEAVSFLILITGSCFMTAGLLWQAGSEQGGYDDYWVALRYASFNLITIATDCGFASTDFNKWPIFVPMWMLLLSCLSASSGSTGGGIRMIRIIILLKQAHREFLKFIHPSAIQLMKIGNTIVSDSIITSVTGYIFLYFMCIVVLVFALLLSGLEFVTAFSAIIACFNNAGPGLNEVGPATNFASLNDFQMGVCIVAMLLGRVQIFSILILFVPEFWKK